jgi:GntR family transcriptional regulator
MAAEPMYRQIADALHSKIDSGELAHGAQLPTEIELMDQNQASRNTVRDAIKLLTTRGLVETRPGQGTFVTGKIDPYVTTLTGAPDTGGGGEGDAFETEVKKAGRNPRTTEPRVEIQRAGDMAEALAIETNARVVSRHQARYIDDTAWSLQTTFYPMKLVDENQAMQLILPDDIKMGTVAYLRTLGIKQASYRDKIAVRKPNADEVTFFKLPADGRVSVFEISRVAFDEKGERFRLTVSIYPVDRNQFAINIGPVPASSAD